MNRTVIGAACGVLALLNIGLEALSGVVSDAVMGGTLPALVGSTGMSITLYLYLARIVGTVLPAALAAGLGYWAVARIDGPRLFRRLGLTAAAGSVGGVLAAVLVLAAVNAGTGSLGMFVVAAVSAASDASVVVVASVLAGAALGSEEPLRSSGASGSAAEATG